MKKKNMVNSVVYWIFVGFILTCIVDYRVCQTCNVEGCQTCITGYSDRCESCKKSGWAEEFKRDGTGAYRTCKKQTSTGVIIAIVLSICGFIFCLAVIFLFYWIQLKKLIAKNIEFFSSRRTELIEKKEKYEQEKKKHEPEIKEYVRQKSEYDIKIKQMKDMRDKIEDLERRQQQEEEYKRLQQQAPQPPPMYNIFVEMEKDYIQRQAELQRAQSMRLPPGFLDNNPLPPPIQPLTEEAASFTPSPFGPVNNSNKLPPGFAQQPMGGPQPFNSISQANNTGTPQPYKPSPYRAA